MLREASLVGITLIAIAAYAQTNGTTKLHPEDLPTSDLISKPGPTFRAVNVHKKTTVIVYGDQRFTDPANVRVTNPKARRLLVEKIGTESPDAILLNGDVPYSGDNVNDYAVFKSETEAWRSAGFHIFPVLGNHEFHGDPEPALEHWWSAFPEMTHRRWYSAEIGKSLYMIALDSDASLAPGSDQLLWLDDQLNHLPRHVQFVFINLHHPPVADVQTTINVSHNPRPNEIGLRDNLDGIAPRLHARIIVCAGHIHNYERFTRGPVTYLVSGGGGASPVDVERSPDDLYQSKDFPNYHYVKFVLDGSRLKATMVRLSNPDSEQYEWQTRDQFVIESGQ